MHLLLALMITAAPAPKAVPLTADEQKAILAKTQTVELEVELAALTPGERTAVGKLIEVGQLFQDVYEHSRHPEALAVRKKLAGKSVPEAELYALFQGPIATTLQNERRPFVKVHAEEKGKNVYPWAITAEELAAQPEAVRAELLDVRSVVRRADAANLKKDLAALKRHPVLSALQPGLEAKLKALLAKPSSKVLYAVPYSVAYADQMVRAQRLLWEAADAVEEDDAEFAGYLRNRARDLLSNDYESGDAAWVTGRFKTLNAQIGAYETYDDELSSQKAFYSLSVLRRDAAASGPLAKAVEGLQAFENSLPYSPHKSVRSDIPIGAYDVIADFGQARSANTASILPNDELHARRYGRTILLRANVLKHPQIFENDLELWKAAVAPAHHADLGVDGKLYRTFWHEVGHYLGADTTESGRAVQVALANTHNHFEELKADLVSLFLAKQLRAQGLYDDKKLRQVYASGILRVLLPVKPRRVQAYQTMELMQFNWFLANGLLERKPDGLHIRYDRYHEVVSSMLREVLAVQRAGDPAAANAFIDKWAKWEPLHEELAKALQAKQRYRFSKMQYGALKSR